MKREGFKCEKIFKNTYYFIFDDTGWIWHTSLVLP